MLKETKPALNSAFRVITRIYFNSDHIIDFCIVEIFMVLLKTNIA